MGGDVVPVSLSVHVALATDTAYLPWCATAVRSCLDVTPAADLEFHLLHDQPVAATDRDRLSEMICAAGGRDHWVTVEPERLAMLPTKGASLGGRTSWIRVVLADLLADIDRVIYLDADVLVLEPLAALWATDLGGAPLAAVANVVEPAQHTHVRDLGLDPKAYFNAGVLVMDLAAMRAGDTVRHLTDFVAANAARLSWFDQDALNVTFAESWLALHPRWNAQNSLWSWGAWAAELFGPEELAEATSRPAIVHFEGPAVCKPWHVLADHPVRDHYLRTLASTPWAQVPLAGRTALNRAIARLPPDRRIPAYLTSLRAHAALGRVRTWAERRRPPPG